MPGTHPNAGPAPAAVDRRRLLLAALPATALPATALLAAGCAPSAERARNEPDDRRPLALVYRGPQGCAGCAPAVANLLRRARRPYRVTYVGPGTGTPLSAEALADAELYVQPGGGADLDGAWRQLRGSADMMRDWVRGGGSYLGLCFGAYLAGRDPGFDLLPGDTNGYIDSPGTTIHHQRDTVVPVKWRGKRRHMYFQDGPAFFLDDGADADVLATYPNGDAAVVVAPYGKGRVGVSGPHPEADRSWYEEQGLRNPDGVRLDLAYELVEATTRRR
ncbi:BPL-N domain-containing protein [Streptomyces axinellae]|uniref:Biotin-protein ligase N-terminal domain-containing protein n=1 Tax=Streptomyces axinellae TaxID=552788 RepID=A0ABP6CR24_9ACTN